MIPTSHAAARGRPYGLIRKAIISHARPGKNPATKNSTNAARKMIPERIPSTAPERTTKNLHTRQKHKIYEVNLDTKVIVNAEGSRDDLSENMRSFLDYLIEKKATKEQTEAITQPANKKSRLK